MSDTNINDNFKIFSDIFKDLDANEKVKSEMINFIATEKWLAQLGKREGTSLTRSRGIFR